MAEDVKIFDGTNWKSLVGPEGPTAVSADLVNVARLGTDGKLLVAQADLDARYVNITGDTMTGNLSITPVAAQLIVGSTGNTAQTIRSTNGGSAVLNFNSGTNDGQIAQSGTTLYVSHYPSGGVIALTQVGAGQIRLNVDGKQILSASNVGIGVGGNITATGTAHNFQPNSILVTAISGLKLDSLSDVDVTTPASGQVLRYNGTRFVNALPAYADITGSPEAATTAGLPATASGTVGTSTAYARADHTHSSAFAVLETASRVLRATDVGRLVCNVYNGASTLTPIKFTFPPAGDTSIPVGSWIDVCDASALSPTSIAAPAGVTFLWNASLTGGSSSAFAGGAGATLSISGMFSRWKIVKTAPDRWILVG